LQANCDSTGQLSALRERTSELEARMREKQLLRRQLMEQLEQLMAQLNVRLFAFLKGNCFLSIIILILHFQSTPMLAHGSSVGPSGSVPPASSRGRSTTSGGIPLGQLGLAGFTLTPQRPAAVSQLQGDLLQACRHLKTFRDNIVVWLFF
jgi:hypothetical protein